MSVKRFIALQFVGPCDQFQCENGGTCIFKSKITQCICKPGYVGQHCESKTGKHEYILMK